MLKILDGFVRMAFLGCHHSKIVPCLWIVWTQLQSLLEILASLTDSFLRRLSVPRL